MSGFLNLGGDGGAMVAVTPARVLGTPFMISLARPALVVYTIQINLTGGGLASAGDVVLRSGRANPPTTDIAVANHVSLAGAYAGGQVFVKIPLTGIILPGNFAVLVVTATSNAVCSIVSQREVIL